MKEGVLEAVPAGYHVVEMKTGMVALKRLPAEALAPAAEVPFGKRRAIKV